MRQALGSFELIAKKRDLRVLVALSVLLGLAYSFVVPFMSLFGTNEVKMSPLSFGIFMTITALAGVFVSTSLARRSDTNVSRRKILLIGGVTGTLGHFGYALVRDPILLTLVGVVFLGASSVTFSQIFAYAREQLEKSGVSEREIPLSMNVIRLAFALSWTFGPAISAFIMARYSFVAMFSAAALFFALFSLIVLFFVPESAPSEKTRQAALSQPVSVALKDPRLLGFFVAFVLYFSCSTMGMMNLSLLITGELGATEHEVGVAYVVAPIFELPFMLYAGVLATRVRHANLIVAALALGTVYYLGLSLVPKVLLVFVLQVLSAAIVAVMSGVAITFFQGFLPNQPGTATNLYASATRIGSIGGYLVFGAMATALGHRPVYAACSLLTAVSALLCAIAARPRPAIQQKSSPSI